MGLDDDIEARIEAHRDRMSARTDWPDLVRMDAPPMQMQRQMVEYRPGVFYRCQNPRCRLHAGGLLFDRKVMAMCQQNKTFGFHCEGCGIETIARPSMEQSSMRPGRRERPPVRRMPQP